MAKSHYNRDVKVPQSVIDEIRKLGMSAAIKKAEGGGASKEFIEGVRRFYPKGQSIEADPKKRQQEAGKKLARARADEAKKSSSSSSSSSRSSSRPQPEGPPAPASSAVDRRLGRNGGKRPGAIPRTSPSTPYTGRQGQRTLTREPIQLEKVPGKILDRAKNSSSGGRSSQRRDSGQTGFSKLTNMKFLKGPDGSKESIADRNKRYGRQAR